MSKFSFENIKIIPLFYIAFVLCTTGLPLYLSGYYFFMVVFEVNSKKHGAKYTMIDDEDYDLVNSFKWKVFARRGTDFRIYKKKTEDSPFFYLHRLIMNETNPAILVDHEDRNPLNNQKSNLRRCTPTQSAANVSSSKNSSSKYLGVSFSERKVKGKNGIVYTSPAWRATIWKNYERHHLGWFKNEDDAAIAYNVAAIKFHGEFANLNKV